MNRIGSLLEAARGWLSDVLECLPWQDVIRRHDLPNALFYLDPPYHGGETDYGRGMFDRSGFDQMAEMLRAISGAFVLSINATSETEEFFAGFEIERVSVAYTFSKDAAKQSPELIVSNRKPVRIPEKRPLGIRQNH